MASTTDIPKKYLTDDSSTLDLNDLSEPKVLYPEDCVFTTDPDLEIKLGVKLDRFGYPADVMNDPDLADIPEWKRQAMANFRAEKIAELDNDDAARKERKMTMREAAKLARAEERERRGIKFVRFECGPGRVSGKLTVIDRDWKKGPLGNYHDGYWICQCECGQLVRVSTRALRTQIRSAKACPRCLKAQPRRHLVPGKMGRPRKVLTGMVIGRLTAGEWFDGLGWLCDCSECGGQEVCINQLALYRRGVIGCDGSCAPKD